ncbi:MAG: anaerobic ribonucleoside-triphosphate reductase activating protein [Clostridia bacterium]|nr:anaerobic ribonucleoside-triphosphate reductase activating protein [Clostridia bacterium]
MELRGLQKTTLLDFPGRVACTVFTGGCNFRCPFCHNASLLHSKEAELTEEKLFSFLDKRRGILDGVCITGGEPLLHRDMAPFISRIKEMGFLVKLDTNGSFPSRLRELCEAGLLDYVAMDIKNSPEKYPLTTGTGTGFLAEVQQSVSLLMKGSVPYEFRTTLVRGFHTEEDMRKIGAWIQGAPRYYLQQFTDSGDVLEEGLSAFDKKESEALLAAVLPFVPTAALRGL